MKSDVTKYIEDVQALLTRADVPTPRAVAYARELRRIAGRPGYALLPSKKNPRVKRWQKLRGGRASTEWPGFEEWRSAPVRVVRFEDFTDVEPVEGRQLMWRGVLDGRPWFIKEGNPNSNRAEGLTSALLRPLGGYTPPVLLVDGDARVASAIIPDFTPAGQPGSRSFFQWGRGGPAGVDNYWEQVFLSHLVGDEDRHAGNYGFVRGKRWDIDYGLANGAVLFTNPGYVRPTTYRVAEADMRRVASGATKHALQQYDAAVQRFLQEDPEAFARRVQALLPEDVYRVDPEAVAALQDVWKKARAAVL